MARFRFSVFQLLLVFVFVFTFFRISNSQMRSTFPMRLRNFVFDGRGLFCFTVKSIKNHFKFSFRILRKTIKKLEKTLYVDNFKSTLKSNQNEFLNLNWDSWLNYDWLPRSVQFRSNKKFINFRFKRIRKFIWSGFQ